MFRSLRSFAQVVGTAACLAALPVAAQADTIEFTGFSWAPPATVQVGSSTFYAGEFTIIWDGVSSTAFCIETGQTIQIPQTYTYTKTPITGLLSEQLGRLFETYYDGVNSAATSGAFQVAVWSVMGVAPFPGSSDPDWVLGTGLSWATEATKPDSPLQTGNWTFFRMENPDNQDQLTFQRVPAPATALLFGAGLLGLAAIRRARASN